LTWNFPPLRSAGCVRTWNIAKNLKTYGWDITVVTPHPSVFRHLDASEEIDDYLKHEGIARIMTDHQWRCLVPEHLNCWNEKLGWLAGGICRTLARRMGVDKDAGWTKAVERACSGLTADDVDIILASGPPFGAFSLAKRLAERLGKPYVLDYRDPWTGNPHHGHLPPPTAVKREEDALRGCAAVTIVSPSWGLALGQRFGIGAKLHIMTNGYDSGEMADIKPYDFGHCAFVYAGIFYPPKRIITPFLAALKLLKESLPDSADKWYFHYYGVDEDHIQGQADRFGLVDRIVYHGRVPRQEVLSAVKGANLSVVITSVTEQGTLEDKGIVTGKIFEAIGLGAPVLLIAPIGSDAEAITEPTGLVKSFTGTEIQGMVSFLKDVVGGQVLEPKNREICSWTTISKNLDATLRRCMTSSNTN
jgi:glycosyltransferase involved in cell wall biosynthesis